MTPEDQTQESACVPASFGGLGIAPKLLDILEKKKFVTPTPIQRQAIPAAMEGQDIIGIAQTGTGKTLAFGIPMIQRLARYKGRGLAVLPTRELALQVEENLLSIGQSLGLRTAVLIGGASMEPQKKALAASPHIIVATPGRLIDHLEQRTVDLSSVSVLVFDEADRMLDMGFLPQIRRILKHVPKERQTMLFSATMPDDIVRIAAEHMKMPVRVEVAPAGTAAERVEHELFVVKKDQKNRLLEALLGQYHGSILVFTRTRFAARRVARIVKAMGVPSADIHSDRSLAQRREALDGFKTGKYRVLVGTDVASRGIDVTGIEVVINYDIPQSPDDYVHRIGRTGRAGMKGKAISFAMPDEGDEIEAIEKLSRIHLPVSGLPELPPDRRPEPREEYADRGARGDRGGRDFGRHGGRGERGGWGVQRGGRPQSSQPRPAQPQQGQANAQRPPQSSGGQGGRPFSQPQQGSSYAKATGDRQRQRPQYQKPQNRNDKPRQDGRRDGHGGGHGNNNKGGISDDLIGISLWPDTPNLHGGLNRKPLDDHDRGRR